MEETAEIIDYKEGAVTADEINRELDAMNRKSNNLPPMEETEETIKHGIDALLEGEFEANQRLIEENLRTLKEMTNRDAWRQICKNAEDVVTVYGAMSTYLKVLVQQPEEDLETIARVARLMIAIKPQAVEASQEIARTATKDS